MGRCQGGSRFASARQVSILKNTLHIRQGLPRHKAKSVGLSTEQILERAKWSKAATFYRFYHKQTTNPSEFQDTVLPVK